MVKGNFMTNSEGFVRLYGGRELYHQTKVWSAFIEKLQFTDTILFP